MLTSRMRRSSGETRRRPSRGARSCGRTAGAPLASGMEVVSGLCFPSASGFLVAVADAVEGFDHVEVVVHLTELLAHALDVAVDGAVVDIDILAIGGVDQLVTVLHHAR